MRDSILYVFGGRIPLSADPSAAATLPLFASLNLTSQSLDSSTQPSWQTLPSANAIPVLYPQCVLTDTHLLIVGGQPLDPSIANPFAANTAMTYCGLQAFSFAEQAWQMLLPEANADQMVPVSLNRTGHAAAWIENVGNGSPGLFVMGGDHFNATSPANDAFMLSPFIVPAIGGQAIIGVSSIPNNLPPPTINSGAAVVDGGTSVLFFGGKTPTLDQPTSIWEYTPLTQLWKTLPVQLPNGMPNVLTGWVDAQQELVIVDVSTENTAGEISVVPLAGAGLKRRQAASSSLTKMNGYSVAFDPAQNLAIVSGGDGSNPSNVNIYNVSAKSWSQITFQRSIDPSTTTSLATSSPTFTATSTTASASLTSSAPTSSATGSDAGIINASQATGFNKANLLAPVILGSILGLLGLLGLLLLCISYQRRKSKKKAAENHASVSPAGLWLKYGNRNNDNTLSKAIGGEIFLRNLEEKHGLKRKESGTERRKTGWSKYFSASWYNSGNPRASASTTNTARALVSETRGQNAPYGGGWDAESHYSKASSFVSDASASVYSKHESYNGRWSGIARWSYNKKTRASNASSGVLGGSIGSVGAGGVYRV